MVSAQISFKQVGAYYAISSLVGSQVQRLKKQEAEASHLSCFVPHPSKVYCYEVQQLDYQRQQLGSLTVAVGQVRLLSEITWETSHLVFAVLHLGGWDFHCCIQPFTGRRAYSQLKDKLFECLAQGSAAQMILEMTPLFGGESFSLKDLFAEERHRMMRLLSHETLTRLDQLYTQVYRDNYGILMAFHRDQLPVPQELQVAAEICLSNRCIIALRALDGEINDRKLLMTHLAELEAIANESNHLHCHLQIPEAKPTLEKLILRSLWQLLFDANSDNLDSDVRYIERLIKLANQLDLNLSLARCQELYFSCLQSRLVPQCQLVMQGEADTDWDITQLRQLLQLGENLAVDVSFWLHQLP